MKSTLSSRVQAWCMNPVVLWDPETTNLLVSHEWKSLREQFCWKRDDYSTAGHILNSSEFIASKWPISTWAKNNPIYIEIPRLDDLHQFYAENDLSLVEENDLISTGAVEKLDDGLKLLNSIPDLVDCVSQLVRVIGVLKSVNSETDVSYSHPSLPFSIFVSVCNEQTPEASARVAESILHETMHLRHSLIQRNVDLLNPESHVQAQYFSPWRQEERPANGVLHGIFVFRAILEFFTRLLSISEHDKALKYSERRIHEIASQLALVRNFYKSPDLNATGAELARQLANM